jgi:cob(I)alamin adenosyltransferase
VIDLINSGAQVQPVILPYLNRLSDYLFTLARYYTVKHKGIETTWQSGK